MVLTMSRGNCYLCGALLNEQGCRRHLLTHSCDDSDAQACALLKVEGTRNKGYWLYLDLPLTSTLKTLDRFLRDIWLECCNHMSAFSAGFVGTLGMGQRIGSVSKYGTLHYEYDFGSTTELTITFLGVTHRPKQRRAVRLLARNVPFVFSCGNCGADADYICSECMWDSDNPFLCDACAEEHEHKDILLPVTNSPRMGVCAYDGSLDCYTFVPKPPKD